MHDLSSLQVADILRKDFKKWTGQGIDFYIFIKVNLAYHFISQMTIYTYHIPSLSGTAC